MTENIIYIVLDMEILDLEEQTEVFIMEYHKPKLWTTLKPFSYQKE